ncbi:MAG: hypothetical protein R3E89_18930 [Thiolinea sp.]
MLIMFYEVVMRYIFFKPTLWVNEMSLWAAGMVYVTAGLYRCGSAVISDLRAVRFGPALDASPV